MWFAAYKFAQLLLQNNAMELCALVWGLDSCGSFVFVLSPSISYLVFTNILRKRDQDFQAAGFVVLFPLENIKHNSGA